MNDIYGQQIQPGLLPRKQKDYLGTTRLKKPHEYKKTMPHLWLEDIEHKSNTQYLVKRVLQVFGKSGAESVIQEMT